MFTEVIDAQECYVSSNIPTDSQKVFDGRDNVFKEGTVFDFWFILECAGYIQNDFCLVHYTYFMEWNFLWLK